MTCWALLKQDPVKRQALCCQSWNYFKTNRLQKTGILLPLCSRLPVSWRYRSALSFQTFGERLPRKVKTLAVYGGVSINPQMIALQNVEILVATPGRLLELISYKALSLAETRILVLDEADKMLNMGFADEMRDISFCFPKKRRAFCSQATLGDEVDKINKDQLRNPLKIENRRRRTEP